MYVEKGERLLPVGMLPVGMLPVGMLPVGMLPVGMLLLLVTIVYYYKIIAR